MADHQIRFEVGDWNFGIAKFNTDDRNAGTARHADVGAGIAHHDRGGQVPAGAGHCLPQYGRVGL